MPQRVLALEVTPSSLKAAVVETSFRDYRVAELHEAPLSAANGTVEEQLRRFIEERGLAADTVLSALPGESVTWRTLFLPFRDRKRLDQTVPFELENQVPFGLDEVIVDYQVLHRDRSGTLVLAALVPKQEIERHLSLLQGAGIDPKVVDVGPLATLNALRLVPDLPDTFAFIDLAETHATVALFRNATLVGLRTVLRTSLGEQSNNGSGGADGAQEISPFVAELRWTLLALNGAPLDTDFPCYLAGHADSCNRLQPVLAEAIGLDIRRLDRLPLKKAESDSQPRIPAFASSVGLALREVTPTSTLGLNFRRGEFAYHRSQQEIRRRMRAVAALAAVLVAFTVADLYTQYRQLGKRLAALDAQVQEVFAETLPDVGRSRQPLVHLQSEVEALQQRLALLSSIVPVGGATSVDILRAISAAVPTNVRLDTEEYTMDPGEVRLRGNSDNAESVDAIKQEILAAGFFSDTVVDYVRAAKDGRGVDFRITLKLSNRLAPGEERP